METKLQPQDDLVMPPTQYEATLSVVCVWNCSCYIYTEQMQAATVHSQEAT